MREGGFHLVFVNRMFRGARRGMWRNGVDIETPGEYKKRYATALGTTVSKEGDGDERCRWLSKLSTIYN